MKRCGLLVLFFCLPISFLFVVECASEAFAEIKIGILAKRGKERCMDEWQATADHLTAATPYSVIIVPLDFSEVHPAVGNAEVDFILTNPAMYASLENRFGVSRIATLLNKYENGVTSLFGGVIFCKSGNNAIRSISDLKKKSFMAVDERSFGGWAVGWRHFLSMGLDPFDDFSSLTYGGTHDAVVYAVRDGKVDAGIVRTSTLERMAAEKKINLADFFVLDPQVDPSFPLLLTTRLYPEWPFAKLKNVSGELSTLFALELFKIPANSVAALKSNTGGWIIPLDYQPIHECLKELKLDPYADLGRVSLLEGVRQHWQWVGGAGLVLFLTLLSSVYLKRMNNKLSVTMEMLDHELRQRRNAETRLKSFKHCLDNIHDFVFMFKPDNLRFFYVNHGAVRQTGYSEQELLLMSPKDIRTDYDEKTFREMFQPLLDGTKAALAHETVFWHKDGYAFPVEIRVQYIDIEGGEGRFVLIGHDISEREREEKEKKKMETRLLHSQKLESVGQLAAGIAHEINTPTQYVETNVEFFADAFKDINNLMEKLRDLLALLKEKEGNSELIAEFERELEDFDWDFLSHEIPLSISQSREGLKRVAKIVLAMKTFSHPGSKEKSPANINEILETTLIVARNEWKSVADVQMDLEADLPAVPCHPDEMGQVFLNILVNGVHSIVEKQERGDEAGKGLIAIRSLRNDGWVEVRITDSGLGIPDFIHDRIFDPFFTTKEVGKGSGQGMAIARDVVVTKHKGTIAFETEQGKGTTFIVRLPLV